ncbi:MAG: nucleotidyltransferase family protein [Candidatus Cloacimonadota bacterium]|nr:nucleotidyltransferase family protein [Candidatus Cloacimonadota bacterium]
MFDKDIKRIKKRIISILKRYDVVHAGIFGSFARGEMRKYSDIDILIEFRGEKSLLDLVGLKLELEENLGRRVDVVEYSTIHPRLKAAILKEQITVL